ncbi:hypothetical protein FZEAL_1062 [Fusarium zealandicum]|uniref:Apple domain-containing protein n=1 Tax=Fusarium zealandicum TaxID=1053134 RepID=A0A8H4XP57_9HYPO|nr:hypothetical protein FZEAL_1062 [Fusarium zealandicum]
MVFRIIVGLAAALAVAGVNAGPCQPASSTSLSITSSESASLSSTTTTTQATDNTVSTTTTPTTSAAAEPSCISLIENPETLLPGSGDTSGVEACALSCAKRQEGCDRFEFLQGAKCDLYGIGSELTVNPRSINSFYKRSCFKCGIDIDDPVTTLSTTTSAASTTTSAMSTTTSAPNGVPSCGIKQEAPGSLTCGIRGNLGRGTSVGVVRDIGDASSLNACAGSCFTTRDCGFFLFWQDNFCYTFSSDAELAGFEPYSFAGGEGFELGCFACGYLDPLQPATTTTALFMPIDT